MDILDKMSAFLLQPKKKYLLLLNRGTFSHALKHLNMVEEVPEVIEKSLEKKLGFSSVHYTHRMMATSDIFKGAPITVWDGTNGYFQGYSEGHSQAG